MVAERIRGTKTTGPFIAANNCAGKLVELRRPHHRPGHLAGGDQRFLTQLSGVVTGGHPVDSDDRKCHVVTDARRHLGGQQVARGSLEESDRLASR